MRALKIQIALTLKVKMLVIKMLRQKTIKTLYTLPQPNKSKITPPPFHPEALIARGQEK